MRVGIYVCMCVNVCGFDPSRLSPKLQVLEVLWQMPPHCFLAASPVLINTHNCSTSFPSLSCPSSWMSASEKLKLLTLSWGSTGLSLSALGSSEDQKNSLESARENSQSSVSATLEMSLLPGLLFVCLLALRLLCLLSQPFTKPALRLDQTMNFSPQCAKPVLEYGPYRPWIRKSHS